MAEPMAREEIRSRLSELDGWQEEDGWLVRRYRTGDWRRTCLVAGGIQLLAEAAGHHPDLELGYPALTVRLRTHDANGITAADFELARRIEETVTWRPGDGSDLPGPAGEWIE
jgi:4a-hydroxytetrahydrobiopterin dehydratase